MWEGGLVWRPAGRERASSLGLDLSLAVLSGISQPDHVLMSDGHWDAWAGWGGAVEGWGQGILCFDTLNFPGLKGAFGMRALSCPFPSTCESRGPERLGGLSKATELLQP